MDTTVLARCGTDMEFEDFRSGGDRVVPGRILPSSPENGLEVPKAESFDKLVGILRSKTTADIVAILANLEAEELYGTPESTIRNVASDVEGTDTELAYSLYLANWEKFRDSDSLAKLVELASKTGRTTDAFKYARISQYLGEDSNPFHLIASVDYENGGSFVESVLAGAIVRDPNRVPYLSDKETARFLKGSREYDESRLARLDPTSKEAWETKLSGLEYRALTLLDPVALRTYVRTLSEIARDAVEIEGGTHAFLAEHACSAPSAVAEAHYAFVTNGESIVTDDRTSVADTLYRRFAHVSDHFLDHRFTDVYEDLRKLFTELDSPISAYSFDKILQSLKTQKDFYEAFPPTVNDFRNRLLAELSSAYGSAYYPRMKSWAFGRKMPFRMRNHGVGALLLVDALAHEEGMTEEIANMADKLWKLPVIPEVASLVAFGFAAKNEFSAAAEWLSRSNLDDAENSALLLRIVAEFRELSPTAIDAFKFGAPVARPSAEHALSRVRSIVANYEAPLASEMLGDSEAGFGDPSKALAHYAEAYRLGNVPALKKLADLEYAMGRFDEAIDHYGALYLDARYAAEVAPRLCMDACEKGNSEAAKEYYGMMDSQAPENFGAVAEYHAFAGDLFTGMCELAPQPGVLFGDLSPELRREYETYAESLVEDVPSDGKLSVLPSAETFPAKLVALRASAVTFLR